MKQITLLDQVIDLIANKYKISIEEARDRFYKSNVFKLLDNDISNIKAEEILSIYEEENNEIYIELKDNEWPFTSINHDRVIVRAIVIDNDNNFYFVRAKRDDIFGKATLIETSGGGVEPNENLLMAIKRELKEELGAEIDIICKIGVISDYYNLINRHNINNYYLCKVVSFGEKHLTQDEIEDFHLSTLKLKYEDALEEYQRCSNSSLGRLIANREVPILIRAKQIISPK